MLERERERNKADGNQGKVLLSQEDSLHSILQNESFMNKYLGNYEKTVMVLYATQILIPLLRSYVFVHQFN